MFTLRLITATFLLCSFSNVLFSQSSHIYHQIEKLGVLGTALYVAAHPDDENTRVISHFSNERKVRTIYLSLTRGDGGQNLIGPELGSQLGLIRTHELLAARNIDGGEQFFTRANDFGYSKSPEETLEIWENDKVLADVVWAIRKFKPDVIVNRFNHEHNGRTHGHHTASAMLSYKAFELAADPKQFPEQLKYVAPWQPSRLYFNTSWWFYGSREKFAEADKSNMAEIDIGTYFSVLGASNNEIAAKSRSMHKCQGFGAELQRGSQIEYLELLLGEGPENKNDIFDGMDLTWHRIKNGHQVSAKIEKILASFKVHDPQSSLPDLLQLKTLIEETNDPHWKKVKLAELESIILDCLGLFARASIESNKLTKGQTFNIDLELVNRSDQDVRLTGMHSKGLELFKDTSLTLLPNDRFQEEWQAKMDNVASTNPYWINENATMGMYHVEDQEMIGLPTTPNQLSLKLDLMISGQDFVIEVPVVNEKIDPVDGESINPVLVSSGLSLNFDQDLTMFKPGVTKKLSITVSSDISAEGVQLEINANSEWNITPSTYELSLKKGQQEMLTFSVTAPSNKAASTLTARAKVGIDQFSNEEIVIAYNHIPNQQVVRPSQAKIICTDINFPSRRIAYIDGAGDKVAESLEQVGYRVESLSPQDITKDKLRVYDAVIVGIRAFNTVDELKNINQALFDFAKSGGLVIAQYNTRHRLVTEDLAPYPIKLSRLRVTDENSNVDILIKDHAVINYPNLITANDFQGWVQERGLYFPEVWDEKFAAPLAMNDKGEAPLAGSLLIANHGQGHYVYTSLSWFRQLPAGVEGAYKLFANILALGKSTQP